MVAPLPLGIAGPVECQSARGRVLHVQDEAQDRLGLKTNRRLHVVEQALAPRHNNPIKLLRAPPLPLCTRVYDNPSTAFSCFPVGQRPFRKMKISDQRRAAFPPPAASTSFSGLPMLR